MRLTAVSISKSLGVSRQAVDKAIKRGRIDPNKPIEQILIDWQRNADPLQRSRGLGAVVEQPAPVQTIHRPAPASAARRSENDDEEERGPAKLGGLTKFDLEMRDMAVRLKLRQLALREKEDSLIRADEAEAAWAALVLNAKSHMMQLGDELSDALACSSDRVHCKKLIDDKVYELLTELARYRNGQ
jgi:biotin operon repressor